MSAARTTVTVALCCCAAGPVSAQLSVTVRDISPDQSSSDASDPDGASGGRVNGIGVDRRTPGRLWAASEWGGLFRSLDNGLTWTHVEGHVPVATWDVEVDPTNSNRIFATSFFDGRASSRAGINVSTDGGTTWVHPASATPPANFCLTETRRTEPAAFGISVDPSNASRVFIGTNCGLARSTDGGSSWTFVDPTPADRARTVWDVVVHDGGIIDVCGDDGHLRSTDGGTTWTTATSQPLPGGLCSLAVSPDESYVLFAVVGISIYESEDGGQTWPGTYANPSPQGRIPFVATNQRAGATYDLWFGDVSLHRATCTTPSPAAPGGAQRCDASAAWAGGFTRAAGGHDDTADIAFAPGLASDACPVLFASDGGVYRNTLTTSPACHTPAWEQPNVTPHALWNFTFTGVPRAGVGPEDLYLGNQDDGSFGTTSGGAAAVAWTNERCCDGFDTAGEPTRGLSTICCFSPGRATRLFLSGPGLSGASPEISVYPGGNMRSFEHLNSLVNFGANSYLAATTTGVFVSLNMGGAPTWTQLGAATSPGSPCGTQVAFNGGAPTFFVKSRGCSGDAQGTLWRYQGTGGGGTWQQVPNPGVGSFGIFAVDRNDPQRIIASNLGAPAGARMVMTLDGGATWVPLPALDAQMTGGGTFLYSNSTGPNRFTSFSGYPQPTLVAFDPADRDIVVAGAADAGVFISTNGGTRWQRVTDPISPGTSGTPHIPRPYYAHFDHDSPTGDVNVYLGTRGRGAWRLTFKKVAMTEIQVPTAPAFGAVCLGGTAADTLKVCNTSAGDLVVSSIISSNPEFTVVPPSSGFPVTVSHDFCFPFEVKFTPTAAGPRSATLTIHSNDLSFPSLVVTATGGGQTSEIRVTGSTDFGVVSAWNTGTRTVAACNVGSCPIDATSASVSCTDFTLENDPLPATLQPGACLDVAVAFTPALPGRHACLLTLTSTSPTTPTATRSLTGRTPPELRVRAGMAWPHGSLASTLQHGSTLNVAFAETFRPNWAWELTFGVSRLDGKAGAPDTDVWHLAPSIRYTFNPGSSWLVFVNGGLGLYHFEAGDFEAGLDLGVGLRRRLDRRFAIEATYAFSWAFTASPTVRYSQVQGGLVVSF
jgi:photosystem II stability/assembly factor-like uncharacterized protein